MKNKREEAMFDHRTMRDIAVLNLLPLRWLLQDLLNFDASQSNIRVI